MLMRKLLTFLTLLVLAYSVGWADTGTITFGTNDVQINDASVTGDDDLGNTWTITTEGTTSYTANPSYYQVGSSKKPATSITFTTTLPNSVTISSMSAKFGGFSGTTGNITLKVGDTSIGTGSLNAGNDVTVYSTSTATGSVLTVTLTGIDKGVKCYNISYTYSSGSSTGPTAPTFKIDGETFTNGTKFANPVTLTITGDNGNSFYYTSGSTTPSDPDTNSTAYTDAISITSDGTYYYKAIAKDGSNNTSSVTSANFVVATQYGITCASGLTGGSVSTDVDAAFAGDDVTVTATANTGYALDEITVTGATSGNSITVTNGKFTMPTEAVTVSATFEVSNTVFYESFNKCQSTGGNDNSWSGSIASSQLAESQMDNIGWSTSGKIYAANNCIRSAKAATAVSPSISVTSGTIYKLTFKAGAWSGDNTNLPLSVSGGNLYSDANCTTSISSRTLANAEWTSYEVYIRATSSSLTITFGGQSNARFFLDEVKLDAMATVATYTVTATASPAGAGTFTFAPAAAGTDGVTATTTVTVTATPATGYEFASWSYTSGITDSDAAEQDNVTMFDMPASDVALTATFSKIQYSITNKAKLNGADDSNWTGGSNANFSGVSTVGDVWGAKVDDQVSFNANTKPGYQILQENISIKDADGNDVSFTFGNGNLVTFTMPASNVTITCNFTDYRPPVKLAGHFNGNSTWRAAATDCPSFTYVSNGDKYTMTAYFTGLDDSGNNDFFYLLVDGVAKNPKADQGNYYIYNLDGTVAMPFELSGGASNNFGVAPGVYDIEINGALTSIKFTKKLYSLAFSPASGSSVETGSTASASCALSTDIAAIKAADSGAAGDVTVGVNDDNGSMWNDSYTFVVGDVGSKTVYGKAYIGNIAVTDNATYTVTPVDNSNKYELVTSTSDLVAGKKYIIVANHTDDGYYALSSADAPTSTGGTSANHRAASNDLTVSGTIATIGSGVSPLTLEGSTGQWKFNTGSGYLYLDSDNNNLKLGTPSTASNANASITFEEGNVAKIVFDQFTSRWIQYNRNAQSSIIYPRFACYAGTQTDVYLYRQVATGDYTITYAPVEGGSLSGPADANAGVDITVRANPSTGYACTSISVSPSAPVTDNHDGTYTFTMPASNVTVTPTWAEAIAITYVNQYYDNNGDLQTGDTGGKVTGPSSAVADNEVRLTVNAEPAYQLQSLEYAWATGHAEVPGTQAGNPFFLMPGTPTTVTAVFEKKPFNITVVSPNGQVTGIPATAVSGQTVSFTVTSVAGYTITNVFCTWVDGEQEGSVTVDSSNAPTYSFVMPAKDVTVRVGYFAGDEYELLTDINDIVEGETYLIVGGAAISAPTPSHVMGTTLSSGYYNAIALVNGTNYNTGGQGYIQSSSSMSVVTFEAGTDGNAGKWAIHTGDGYIGASGTNVTNSSTAAYMSITLGDNSRATIELGSNQLSFNNSSPRFKFYSGPQGATYIYKLANSNKVKKPTITGAAGQYIGLYNFIGTDQVTLACATDGATIKYKIGDATEWTTYSGEAFALPQTALDGTVTVTAKATKDGMDASGEVSAVFTCVKPEWHTKPCGDNWSCADQQYDSPVFIYPNGSLANRNAYGKANIRFFYTLDGTTPTMASDEVPTPSSGDKFIFLDEDVTLKIIPVINDIVGDPVSGIITFVPAAPTATLAAGLYDGDQQTRLSTTTKEKISNTTWTTQIWYTLDSSAPAFAFSNDGTVTSTGWTRYDPTTAPYIDIKVENGNVQTLRSVTLTNFISGEFTGQYSGASVNLNSTGTWTASATTSTTYTLTAANLDVVFSPAGGTYLYSKDVTLTPQNAIGAVTMKYDITWANPDATHVSATGVTYDGAITVDRDATITVHASDSRTGDGGTYEKSHTYKIGVQEPLYSPYPGDYQDENTGDYLYGNFYVVPSSGTSTINVEIFDVTPNAKIYYTVTETTTDDTEYDGSKPYPLPDTPTNANGTLYTGPITLTAGNTYVFSAVAYVGNMVSSVRTRTFTVRENTASGNYWYSIKEMNEETDHSTTKTLANPVEIIYMSTYQNNGTTPEFAFVRDNSGYGYIYFGKNATGKDTWKKYNPGEWIKGMTIRGKASTWSASYINELDLQSESDNTAWNAGLLDPRALVPEYTTCRAIREGWTGGEDFTGSDYEPYVDKSKHMFGHYVHLRRNTLSGVSKDNNGKYQGTIVGELGTKLFYYDGLYLYSGFNGSKNYDQTFFNSIQEKGGTFEVYGIAYFYGPNAAKASSYYQPYEIFPIDFDWIFPPIFHLEGDASASDMTNDTPERTIHAPSTVTLSCDTRGAVIMYKTSDMEDYEVYNGEDIAVNKTMTISTYSIHSTEHFDQMESKVRTLTINMGDVKQPVISPESCVKAIGDEAVTVSITCETSEATIWYTTDGSDPDDETNTGRSEYTGPFTVSETTTVRAVASAMDGSETFYGMEAESKTYTFVKSNGIVYDLVKSASQLDPGYVYVIVNKQYNAAVMNVQDTNNRKSAGVKFLESTDAGYTGEKEQVFGNDDLAVFTLNNENGNWVFHTANGVNNASIGYMYGAVSGSTNQWKSEFTKDSEGKTLTTITIDGDNSNVDKAYAAHILYTGGSGDRYLRFNKSYDLFNTYSSEMTGQEVFLYRKLAWPLAKIEKVGVKDREYTISDELIGVYANGTKLWAKDQGNVSISKRENTEGWEDYVAAMYPSANNAAEWDQSNWVCLELGEGKDQLARDLVGQFIDPTSVTGTLTDDVNYTITVSSTPTSNNGDADFAPLAFVNETDLNVMTAPNFNDVYTTGENGAQTTDAGDRKFFFVRPKVQEVVLVTNVTWNGSMFVVPKKSGIHNTANFDGAITVDWSLCDTYNAQTGPEALDAKMSEEGFGDSEFTFMAVVSAPKSGGSSNPAPRRVPKDISGATTTLVLQPTSITLPADPTGVDDVKVANREVKAVKYVDVVGRVSDRPFEGLNIIVTEYTDGSVETVKVLK